VADAAAVQDGVVEWNTLCKQTCTLFKDPSSAGSWRPKEFVFKVRQFDRAGSYQHGRTIVKAALDLSSFCMAQPYGPRQMTIPLRWGEAKFCLASHTHGVTMAYRERAADMVRPAAASQACVCDTRLSL
jgi:hypothetical protein